MATKMLLAEERGKLLDLIKKKLSPAYDDIESRGSQTRKLILELNRART